MLKINDLKIITNTGRKLVDGFSFVLNEGDKIALIGEEGNGKSTLLKIIAGVSDEEYVTYSGSVYCDEKIGYLPQRLSDEDLKKDVLSYIGDPIDYNELYQIINRIGIDDELLQERTMSSLSGGERVKIALAKILYDGADILLLDEPSNDLDLKTLIWLEQFILNTSLPLIFVSHDETLLENCANGILHLEQLKRKTECSLTYESLGYRQYLESRNAFITRNNMIASKQRAQLQKQLDRWRTLYQKVEHRQNTISRGDPHGGQLLKKKMKNLKSQERNLQQQKENMRKTFEPEEAIDIFFEDVKLNPDKVILDLHLKELRSADKLLVKDLDLKVLGKDKVCIIGDNGTGKTTLLKDIYERLKDREDIRVGYMPQNYQELLDYEKKPLDFLWDRRSVDERKRIQTFLGTLKFTSEEMEHRISELSEGQKCKILLAKMILEKKDVLILDEPSRNLSPLSNPQLRKMLSDFKGCIIAVSHDRKFIFEAADKVYELRDRRLSLLE